jgi:prevent-host-death family protein
MRALRNETAKVIDAVKSGEVLEITEYGHPVARIVPLQLDRWEQLRALGEIEPASETGDILDVEPLKPAPGLPLPSKVLEKLRAGER